MNISTFTKQLKNILIYQNKLFKDIVYHSIHENIVGLRSALTLAAGMDRLRPSTDSYNGLAWFDNLSLIGYELAWTGNGLAPTTG